MSPHGTTTEKHGCSCDWCRARHVRRTTKYRVRASRRPLMVDAALPRRQVRNLHRLMTYGTMAERCGVSARAVERLAAGRPRRVQAETAERIDALWHDYRDPTPPTPDVRLSAAPLIAHINARYGSAWAAGVWEQMARLEREGLTVVQADKWAIRLDAMPHELWPEAFV